MTRPPISIGTSSASTRSSTLAKAPGASCISVSVRAASGCFSPTTPRRARVGNQTGGQPVGVVYTDDIHGDFARLADKGVKVAETVQSDEGSFHFRFHDLYGNQWVLVQLNASAL